MGKTRKIIAAGAALAVAAALAVTGTLALNATTTVKVNELFPGARLHRDYDGEYTRNVYVENYDTSWQNASSVFVRIRLDEYLEVGGASVISGGKKADKSTWRTRTPALDKSTGDGITSKVKWVLGGDSIYYMPTFDVNNESQAVDENGTEAKSYKDYIAYKQGDTKTDTEKRTGGTTAQATHTARQTPKCTVITMDEWLKNPVSGNYWVWDSDGWFYWAKPVNTPTDESKNNGKCTTGTLLSGVSRKDKIEGSTYYGLNVVAEIATSAVDRGVDGQEGFYSKQNGGVPSANAVKLLETIGGEPNVSVTITQAQNRTEYSSDNAADSITYQLVDTKHNTALDGSKITWSVSGKTKDGTKFASTTGTSNTLTVATGETGTLTVTATYAPFQNGDYTQTSTVTLIGDSALKAKVKAMTAGSANTVTVSGIEWYCLAQDTANNRALLLSKYVLEQRKFDEKSSPTNIWRDSTLRTYLNGTWLNEHSAVSKYAKQTDISTITAYSDGTRIVTQDRVFPLNRPDFYNTSSKWPEDGTNSMLFAYDGKKLPAPGGKWETVDLNGTPSSFLLRGPGNSGYVNILTETGGDSPHGGRLTNTCGVRPAFWFDLSK